MRLPQRLLLVVLGMAVAAVGVAGAGISGVVELPGSVGGFACANVAAERGLDFVGSYGTTVADDEMGASMQRNMGNGAAVGDINDDGYLDVLLLGQAGHPSRLFANIAAADGGRRFSDITDAAGLGGLTGLSRAAQFADLDADGDLDLVVANDRDPAGILPPSRLFRNDGTGRFTDVTAGSGFDLSGYLVGGLALVDYNHTGRLSIYVSMWTLEVKRTPLGLHPDGHWPGENRLYENLGGMRFRDVTDDAGLAGVHEDTFSALFHDWDGNGSPDLYLAVDHREDRFYRNDDGHFTDVSAAMNVGHLGTAEKIAAGDVDGDGSIDLYVTNVTDPEDNFGTKPPGNTLLLAQRSSSGAITFLDDATHRGVRATGWGWGTVFTDTNLDGAPDLFAVQGFDEVVDIFSKPLRDDRAYLFANDGSGHFSATSETGCDVPGDQRSLVEFDYNRDGRPDYLITQVNLPVLLLENRGRTGNWLTIQLARGFGHDTNAHVTVTAGGRTSSHLIVGGGSFLAGPPAEAYVGLGEAAVADLVSVAWDDGTSVTLRNVPANRLIRVGPNGRLDDGRG